VKSGSDKMPAPFKDREPPRVIAWQKKLFSGTTENMKGFRDGQEVFLQLTFGDYFYWRESLGMGDPTLEVQHERQVTFKTLLDHQAFIFILTSNKEETAYPIARHKAGIPLTPLEGGERGRGARLFHRVTGSTGSECPAPVPVPGTGRYRPVMIFVLAPHTDWPTCPGRLLIGFGQR
jgi:hypothetical protein